MGAREVTGAPGLMEDTYRDLLQRRLSVEQPETAPALAAGRPSAPVALTGEMHQAANRLLANSNATQWPNSLPGQLGRDGPRGAASSTGGRIDQGRRRLRWPQAGRHRFW